MFIPQMQTSSICQDLINEDWNSYATDLAKAPQTEGIYAVGCLEVFPLGVNVIYVGQSIHIRKRLQQHKYQNQAIDEFVKDQFTRNGGKNLFVKWVEVRNSKCLEGNYLDCMYKKLGYWPSFNLKHGNTCN